MKRPQLSQLEIILTAAFAVVIVVTAWTGYSLLQMRSDGEILGADLEAVQKNLRWLRSIDNVSASQKELQSLQAQAPSNAKPTFPLTVDSLNLVYGLLNFPPGAGLKITTFKAEEPKNETIDNTAFQLLSFEVGLDGNPLDMLVLLRRVDDNALMSLRVPAMAMSRADQAWQMKVTLGARLLSPIQPQPVRTPQPAPTGGEKGGGAAGGASSGNR